MSSLQRLIITSVGTAADFKSLCDFAPGKLVALNNFIAYLGGLSGGAIPGASLAFQVGAVQAAGTITSTGTATAAQTMTLLNVTLTARASNPAANEFVVSATPAVQAANIAAAINASASFAGKVTASALEGVVTVTSVVPGSVGNGLQIVNVNLGNVTVGAFANGADGTATTIDLS